MNLQEAMEKSGIGPAKSTSRGITVYVYTAENAQPGQEVIIRLYDDNAKPIGAMPGNHVTGTLTDFGHYNLAELARRAQQHGFTEWEPYTEESSK